ncbi:MAG: S41 family peptidase [Paludibacteraceae bacterium]|nr:S41 family peptidase [Paludibacteraceae bacterium]
MNRYLFSLVFSLLGMSIGAGPLKQSDIQKFAVALYAVTSHYVDTVNSEKMVDNAIVGVLEKLDPHSIYITKSEVKKMNEPLEGSFEGIGVVFQMMEDTLLVIQTISGGPSEKVGIMAGDRFVMVNDSSIAGVNMQNTDIMKKLRGPKGTSVRVKVLRRGVKDLIEFKIVRDKIPIFSLDAAYMVDDEIGYIKINRFSSTTFAEYKTAFEKLKKKGMKSLILDLQDNGGGYMSAAIELADDFLSGGKMLVYTEGANQLKETHESTAVGDFESGNLVILVNESSASASEIVSGAIQDWDRGVIVGRRTFAKGLVQKPVALPDGSQIRLTVARYYTPTGRCIQRPYKENLKNYNKDLIERYNHGELMHEDSIAFPDSLRYQTLQLKRSVYGGGGIMPDIFIPLDTTKYTDYHRNIVAKGVLNKFVLNFLDKERKKLSRTYPTDDNKGEKSFEKFEKEFFISDEVINDLVKEGEKEGVKLDSAQLATSKDLIKLQIKAMLARDLWDTSEYYKIMNVENPIYNKGVEILKSQSLYNSCFEDRKRNSKAKK